MSYDIITLINFLVTSRRKGVHPTEHEYRRCSGSVGASKRPQYTSVRFASPSTKSNVSTRGLGMLDRFSADSDLLLVSILRVAYATASTLQFVSGMSYMAALMLVQEPKESMAYATLVTVLQVSGPL